MLEVHEINTVEGFLELKGCWNEVLARCKDNSATLTWEHIAVSVNILEKEQKLRVLYITWGNKIVAIAPLRLTRYKLAFFQYNVIEPLDYGVATDYTGFILAEKEAECLQLFLTYLYRQSDWDYMYIKDIPETSPVIGLLAKNRKLLPKFEVEKGEICPCIAIPDSIDKFLVTLSQSFKKNLRRSLKFLEKDFGKVELKEYFELGSLEDTMQLFFYLHQKRWASKKLSDELNMQKIRDIFVKRAELFAAKGWFGLFFFTVNNKPIAAKYTLKYNQKLYVCLSVFDPEYSSYSVGNLLLLKVIEKVMAQGIKEYDFMKGAEYYKFKWTKKYRRNSNLKLINNSVTSHLIVLGLKTIQRTRIDELLLKFRTL